MEKEDFVFKINLKFRKPQLPSIDKKELINIKYSLIEPFAYAHIFWDKENKELIYKLEEPELDTKEREILKVLEDGVRELINISYIAVKKGETVVRYLEKNIKILLDELGISINSDSYQKIMYYIYRDFVGLNEIEALMRDYYIEDVECNGVNTPVYVVHRKYRNLRTNIIYKNADRLSSFVEKLAQKCGKYISYANPILEGALEEGSRVSATYSSDVSSRGASFTIRKFTKEPFTPIQLIDLGSVSPEVLAYLWLLIEYSGNIMVIGGTGSGKTSFLNSLAFFIPPQARVVSIEDTKEINILHENWLPSVTREQVSTLGSERYGEVSMFDLLRESFRQRPDYVIVGEIRGKEAYVLFQGLSSGHPGMGTMHANSVDAMVKRLETEPINLSPALIEALDVVCIMIQDKVGNKMIRRLQEVVEIVKVDDSNVSSNVPFKWDPANKTFLYKLENYVFEKLFIKYGISKNDLIKEFKSRTELLAKMYQNKIFGFEEVQEVINAYYKDSAKVLRRFGIV